MEAEQDAVSVEPPERVAVHKVVVPEILSFWVGSRY